MEEIFHYICDHAHNAHWIIFCLLLLTGLNIPISEDILLLSGGAIASLCIPDHTLKLYLWIFFGCYLSAWEAYWIGRLLGPKLYRSPLFRSVITPHRLNQLRTFYAKFGVFTFIIGRFCPGGIRNALFMSSGLTKMPFYLFILRDGLGCLISSSVIFSAGYYFSQNIDSILFYVKRYEHFFIGLIFCLGLAGLTYMWYSHRLNDKGNDPQ